jgi:hypothetical protein
MKKIVYSLVGSLCLTTPIALATSAVEHTTTTVKHSVSRTYSVAEYPTDYAKAIHITLYAGSLRSNITRIANQFGWKQVVWNIAYDYDWVGPTNLTAPDLSTALDKILADYPLQAVFYQGNRVLVIQPRILR